MANPDFKDLDIVDYSKYKYCIASRPDKDVPGLLHIELHNPETKMNAMNARMHREASQIFTDVHRDPTVACVVLSSRDTRGFCAGSRLESSPRGQETPMSPDALFALYDEARSLVRSMVDCDKVIISAINGVAVGAGIALALMADITICSPSARFGDGHTKIGVAAGDHACMIWPLLTGMAKAKYYTLTGEILDGTEADRIGLISKLVPQGEDLKEAMRVGKELAMGPKHALKHTKRALNTWLNQSGLPSFDFSCALEMLDFQHPDAREGAVAFGEKRAAQFPSSKL